MTPFLTPYQLQALQENAEFGDLDHSTASKRHARILASLGFFFNTNEDLNYAPYTNLETIKNLIELLFGKRYPIEEVGYWMQDLVKRDYAVVYEEDIPPEENFFSLTERGVGLFNFLYETKETLFESNSRNITAFMN